MTKICRICGIEKDYNNFNFRKDSNTYRNECKECQSRRNKEYRLKNAEKINKQRKEYRENNREHIKELRKNEYLKYYSKNKEKINEKRRMQYKLDTNNQHLKKRIYHKIKKETDKLYAFKKEIRSLISNSLKRNGYKKETRTQKILKTNYENAVKHLLQTFENNYGYKWDGIEPVHIDHKMPLATAKTEEEVIKLCHYTNLQLLKAEDNLKKGSKLNWKLEER